MQTIYNVLFTLYLQDAYKSGKLVEEKINRLMVYIPGEVSALKFCFCLLSSKCLCPNHLILLLYIVDNRCSCLPMAAFISALIDTLVLCSMYQTFRILRKHLSSNASIFFSISADTVHDSQP